MSEPRRRLDRLALAVNGVALVVIAAVAVYLLASVRIEFKGNLLDEIVVSLRNTVGGESEVKKRAPEPPAAPKPAAKQEPAKPAPVAKRALAPSFELIDMRPPKEKRDFDPGERYAFVVAGDEQFAPDRLSILRERLSAKAGEGLNGKRVHVTRLITWYVRTPAGDIEPAPGMAAMPPEQVFGLPDIRRFPYWVICDVAVQVDERRVQARGTEGFGGSTANFAAHHRGALLRAIDGLIGSL